MDHDDITCLPTTSIKSTITNDAVESLTAECDFSIHPLYAALGYAAFDPDQERTFFLQPLITVYAVRPRADTFRSTTVTWKEFLQAFEPTFANLASARQEGREVRISASARTFLDNCLKMVKDLEHLNDRVSLLRSYPQDLTEVYISDPTPRQALARSIRHLHAGLVKVFKRYVTLMACFIVDCGRHGFAYYLPKKDFITSGRSVSYYDGGDTWSPGILEELLDDMIEQDSLAGSWGARVVELHNLISHHVNLYIVSR